MIIRAYCKRNSDEHINYYTTKETWDINLVRRILGRFDFNGIESRAISNLGVFTYASFDYAGTVRGASYNICLSICYSEELEILGAKNE